MKSIDVAPLCTKFAYDDAGEGLPVILLHAFPLDREMWAPQVGAISAAGYRVIAPDLPGFGGTALEDDDFTVDRAADTVAFFLDSIGVTKAVIAGLSMGGYVAMAIARRHPGLLAGLILADTRAAPDVPHVRANRDKLIDAVQNKGSIAAAEAMLAALVSEPTRDTNPALLDRLRKMILRQSPRGLIAALRALRDRPDAAPDLASVEAPSLVLVGEFDTVTPCLNAARIAGTIPRSDLAHIPGAGHLSNLENPHAFNAAVLAFLKGLK